MEETGICSCCKKRATYDGEIVCVICEDHLFDARCEAAEAKADALITLDEMRADAAQAIRERQQEQLLGGLGQIFNKQKESARPGQP